MSLGDLSLACASLLVEELARGGVRHACVSPGSRSTPIALALARHTDITVHVHLDERSSAFVALGIAKATDAPVAIACTSGTAAAEILPAVVEASQSRVPLVVLTADRPARLRGTGANQTIVQPGLYGSYVREELETPLPSAGHGVVWRGIGARAVRSAIKLPPGPVHVNLPFDEPLTPEGREISGSTADPGPVEAAPPAPARASREDAARLSQVFASSKRGVLVVGSAPVPPVALVSAAVDARWPVLAEPTSGVRDSRALSAGQALIGDDGFAGRMRADVVIQAGATPTSRATQAFVRSARELAVVDAFHLEPDPDHRATVRLHVDPELVAAAMDPTTRRAETDWIEGWHRADERARAVLDHALDEIEDPFEPRIARDVAAWAAPGATLFVGNSTPIRDLELAMAPRSGLRVLANRGASGIDGSVSTALGLAVAGPTVALIGDLTFLYDAGALLWAASSGVALVLVVVRNGGGEVFSLLPQRELPEHRELFTTPHDVDLAALCAAARVGHTRVGRAAELIPALDHAANAGDIQVVEVMVDPDKALTLRERIHDDLSVALGRA